MSLLKGWVIRFDDYGYWTGKSYCVDRECFPVCERTITERTKVYSSPIRAGNAFKKGIEKFGYVTSGEVCQLKEGDLNA